MVWSNNLTQTFLLPGYNAQCYVTQFRSWIAPLKWLDTHCCLSGCQYEAQTLFWQLLLLGLNWVCHQLFVRFCSHSVFTKHLLFMRLFDLLFFCCKCLSKRFFFSSFIKACRMHRDAPLYSILSDKKKMHWKKQCSPNTDLFIKMTIVVSNAEMVLLADSKVLWSFRAF